MKRVIIILVTLAFVSCKQDANEQELVKLSGPIFGTGFNIQYFSETNTNFIKQIDSLFAVVNQSMSTYIPDSDISKLNRNENNEVDHHFRNVLLASRKIHKETKGVFDPTIGAVVNAWSFGPEGRIINLDSIKIDSLMKSVGLDKVKRVHNNILKPKNTFLDFNAIAKGYGIDVISEFLESKGVNNYLVDIGGDLRTSGTNIEKKKAWTVGIDDPNFNGEQSYSKVVELKDKAMATSGTYRKFKVDENGNRYAHIINTKIGYPSKTNVLSVSVIASDCMTADGYATAFQAMGIEKVKDFLQTHPELKVYFIFEDENNELKTLSLNNFPD
ncbi:FAD:protein FMN transferase [Ichthyenterobacterium sp. W332]|uniref:FAD:protein FMN transferase n=1 Tax=Microcosmobacter mediterraneus TaxID=3075607 RepID=A0ABU2YMG3_9FLAO|nr:FAD:protein FMN transferase [Ichthyenterobacterium sp. W332]MDT0559336.1 FAD:protein FMN transferase [Ichthyenterobacterium sp. W332]